MKNDKMPGIKRKSATSSDAKSKVKKPKTDSSSSKRPAKQEDARPKSSKKSKVEEDSDDLIESDTSEDQNGFYGFAANEEAEAGNSEDVDMDSPDAESGPVKTDNKKAKDKKNWSKDGGDWKSASAAMNTTTSREAHAKQKALAKERKAGKANAEIIEQGKELWEKLRLKSHVKKEERHQLLTQLFELVTGRVKDLVFRHDSVRVIQCAIKYSTIEQRRSIARELKGEFRPLAEGKYSKFLIAKLLEKGDPEVRDLIVSELYGHVRRLMNHPEAAWILDDTYRQVATPEQKRRLLREWYGPEFAIKAIQADGPDTADLAAILEASPEKRKPIMEYLEIQINQIIQKKLTGFTMLHDAMLQYFLACTPGSSEANAFLEHLRPDATIKEGEEADNVDLLKNLAFTKSGSRLVSLALAHGSAKDRKLFLRPYKDTVEMMAFDANAHYVLLAALAVVDDTKLTSKSIFGELLPSNETLSEKVLALSSDARARVVLLYPFAADAKWLIDETTRERLAEIYAIRSSTSKKDPNTRLQEVAKSIEPQLLSSIAARAGDFTSSRNGLQMLGEVLVGAPGVEAQKRKEALSQVAELSQQILDEPTIASYGVNMLKTLVHGGKFDPELKKVVPVEPAIGYADMFWDHIKSDVISWATGQGSFVIVALVEAEQFERKDEVLKALKKDKKALEAAAATTESSKTKKKGDKAQGKGNAGARILLQKL
ncbi:ARM repeat-containing protein [Aaosphaeria arxii CBS 175.79]|uniref:ARM repeat-containing protein n=1 Tax=Aaosphaeria arxii CBS 175.79 TaxID=1450172 RepID=A0A6A5Y1F9_9PLEO|nr:ARM repeat-containing protein [Aaosphaeria arxii CBS 175.79]KAF2019033.1 ARM repeat-containing protein [Aaosphaeria arxii CBS 175.79]